MANYLVRVELHNVKPDDNPYRLLHSAMESSGFTRQVIVGGVLYWLPHGNYNLSGYSADPQRVYDLAHEAARAATMLTGSSFGILVSSLDPSVAGGLRRVA